MVRRLAPLVLVLILALLAHARTGPLPPRGVALDLSGTWSVERPGYAGTARFERRGDRWLAGVVLEHRSSGLATGDGLIAQLTSSVLVGWSGQGPVRLELSSDGLALSGDGLVLRRRALPSLPRDHLAVPIVPQSTEYSCGAAATLAVLTYWNAYDGPEQSLFESLGTDDEGTDLAGIVATLMRHGVHACERTGASLDEVRAALGRGATVILSVQAWPEKPVESWAGDDEDGHYVVLVGMDADYAYFMDPVVHASYSFLPLAELLERWHDGGEDRPAVFVTGERPLARFPGELVKME